MAEILYQGHGSFRLTTSEGSVIYIDPYAGEGYDRPADLVLVSQCGGAGKAEGGRENPPGRGRSERRRLSGNPGLRRQNQGNTGLQQKSP